MNAELAAANVNRAYQLAASSIAIFTFLLFFLYPRFVSGDVDAVPYQATLIVMGVATFSFAFSSFYYYGASLAGRLTTPRGPNISVAAIALAARMRAIVPRPEHDPVYRQAAPRRGRVVRAAAGVCRVRDPQFPRVRTQGQDSSPGRRSA